MGKENPLCKKFLLSADWDRAVAALPEKDDNLPKNNELSSADYANRAYARCFQATKDHRDGKYDDTVADASKALVGCRCPRNLCIRAYAYYLNNNYEAAIDDCEKVIEQTDCCVKGAREKMKGLLEDAYEKMVKANEAIEAAEKANMEGKPRLEDEEATKTAICEAKKAQEAYGNALRPAAFARELLGLIYANMGNHHEASKHYKLALLARQTDIVSASPLLMDAYRNAHSAVKSMY
jgi:tetratricopeptide (TPR) repeat protein